MFISQPLQIADNEPLSIECIQCTLISGDRNRPFYNRFLQQFQQDSTVWLLEKRAHRGLHLCTLFLRQALEIAENGAGVWLEGLHASPSCGICCSSRTTVSSSPLALTILRKVSTGSMKVLT